MIDSKLNQQIAPQCWVKLREKDEKSSGAAEIWVPVYGVWAQNTNYYTKGRWYYQLHKLASHIVLSFIQLLELKLACQVGLHIPGHTISRKFPEKK